MTLLKGKKKHGMEWKSSVERAGDSSLHPVTVVRGLWARHFPFWVSISSLTKQGVWIRWSLAGLGDFWVPAYAVPTHLHNNNGLLPLSLFFFFFWICVMRGLALLSWQEWKEELKNLTKLLHRTEDLGEEVDTWDRDDAVEEAIWKLQMFYGNGAERKSYEELLRAKPKGKIPTSRIITLKAEEVASRFFSCIVSWVTNIIIESI